MFEALPRDRHDGQESLMTSGTSLTEAVLSWLIGPATGDSLEDVLRQAVLAGAANLAEMNETGFDTRNMFDRAFLAQSAATHTPYLITSLRTGTVYLVFNGEGTGDVFRAVVQVYCEGEVNDNFFPMTLVRAADGSIRANASW